MTIKVYYCLKCKSEWKADLTFPLIDCPHCENGQTLKLLLINFDPARGLWIAIDEEFREEDPICTGVMPLLALARLIEYLEERENVTT